MLGDNWQNVELLIQDRCAWVTINRPEKLNAITTQMFHDLEECVDGLRDRHDVGVIVITGAGRAFSSGADLKGITGEVDTYDAHAMRNHLRFVGRVVKKWMSIEKPTIAAVNGLALGGGCNLALMCDLILMRQDATIGEVYTKKALVMDMAGTYLLPRLVGRARAMELAFFGDPLSAQEAEWIGLVNRCIPVEEFDATVREWALRLASAPARALGLVKTGLVQSQAMDLDAVLEWEAQAIAMVFQTQDVKEALAAFREKRAPKYNES